MTDTPPADAKFIEPIHAYSHADGLSITGGIVYTGKALPELQGAYVYGDFILGKVWALKTDDSGKEQSNALLYTSPQTPATDPKKKPTVLVKPTAFCANAAGEMLVLDWNGAIYKLGK
jgi:quinoprotein glucose dehydrogenase